MTIIIAARHAVSPAIESARCDPAAQPYDVSELVRRYGWTPLQAWRISNNLDVGELAAMFSMTVSAYRAFEQDPATSASYEVFLTREMAGCYGNRTGAGRLVSIDQCQEMP